MTQTTANPKMSEGIRKIVRELNRRHSGPETTLHVLTVEVNYPDGITQNTTSLFGFWFEGYDAMRVEVFFSAVSQNFTLVGSGHITGEYEAPTELTVASAPGLTQEQVERFNAYARNQPPNKLWRDTWSTTLSSQDDWPSGLKAALMRELGLTT